MRLLEAERKVINQGITQIDPAAEIWLFGSRTDDTLKGGDIDLLVVSSKIGFKEKLDCLVQIKQLLGDQKIDIHIISPESKNTDALAVAVLPLALRI